jgi:hypothetical protein
VTQYTASLGSSIELGFRHKPRFYGREPEPTPMSRPQELGPLLDRYDVTGELAGHDNVRTFVATRRSDGRDVLITVMRAAPDVAEGKAIAQFAADVNLLTGLAHPNMPKVLEGQWLDDDAFGVVSERIHGTTLAELMKGDRMSNPRIADILTDVDGVLEWARGERLAHRAVTPHDIVIERGTGKVYVSLGPTDAPKTSRPEPRDDVHTIGTLATTMLLAKPMADEHDGTLGSMRPDLPQRVVDATNRVSTCTINDELPNLASYLASLAMADAIKEGELEVARVDAEFRAAMKSERENWEAEQLACQTANEAQAKKFAEERAEYERRSSKEREQLAAARSEIDKRRVELQQARTELDQARADFKQRKGELEQRVKDIDRHAKELEKRARDLDKQRRELERKNAELEATARAAATAAASVPMVPTAEMPTPDAAMLESMRPQEPVDVTEAGDEPVEPIEVEREDEEPIAAPVLGAGVESVEDVDAPWTPIEATEPWAVPLETDEPVSGISYEAAALPEPEKKRSVRRVWALPAAVVGLLLVLVGAALAINHRGTTNQTVLASGALAAPMRQVPIQPQPAPVVDSAAGSIAPTGLADSATFAAIRDSIAEADAAKRDARRQKQASDEAASRERAARIVTDSNGVKWTTVAPPPLDSVQRAVNAAKDTVVRSTAKPDTGKSDTMKTVVKKDTLKAKPDTVVKPDTGMSRIRR